MIWRLKAYGVPPTSAQAKRRSYQIAEPRDKTLAPTAREGNVFVVAPGAASRHGAQSAFGRGGIAFAKGKREPSVREKRRRVRVLGQDRLNCGVQRFWICVPFEIHPSAPYPARDVLRNHGQHAVQSGGRLLVAAQSLVSKRDLLKYGKIARIQLQRLLHFLQGFLPATLPPVNVTSRKRNSRFVRERMSGGNQLLLGSVVISIRPIKVLREGQMCLSRIGA